MALGLSVGASAQTHLPSVKVYETGQALEKPAVLRNFVEFHSARKVPDLRIYTLDGTEVDLKDYRGEVIILNIWATWCTPCVQEIPEILSLQKQLKDKKVKLIGVAIDNSVSTISRFLKRMKFQSLQTWVDPTQSVGRIIPLTLVPTNYVLDGRGNLIGEIKGFVPWSNPEVLQFINKLAEKYADPKINEANSEPLKKI